MSAANDPHRPDEHGSDDPTADHPQLMAALARCEGAPMPATLELRLRRAAVDSGAVDPSVEDAFQAHRDEVWSFLLALLGDGQVARDALEEAFVGLERTDGAALPAALASARRAGLESWALLQKAGRGIGVGPREGETRALLLLRGLPLDAAALAGTGALPKGQTAAQALTDAADALVAALPASSHAADEGWAGLFARAALDPTDELRLLAPGDAARLDAHEAECAACAVLRQRITAACEVPFRVCPEAEALAARIEARRQRARDHRQAVAATAAKVSLGCTYCHAPLVRREVYCAGCLAPHHAECFREHGRCSAPGCDERRTVRADPPARPERLALLIRAVFGAAILGGVAAASFWFAGRTAHVLDANQREDERRDRLDQQVRRLELESLRQELGRTLQLWQEAEAAKAKAEQALDQAKVKLLNARLRELKRLQLELQERIQAEERQDDLRQQDAQLNAEREAELKRLALEKQLQAQPAQADAGVLGKQMEATLAALEEAIPAAKAGKPYPLLDAATRLEKQLMAAKQAGLPPEQLEKWAARLAELEPLRAAAEEVAVEQTTRELLADLQAVIDAGDTRGLEKIRAAVLAQAMELRATGRAELIARADALEEKARALMAGTAKPGEEKR